MAISNRPPFQSFLFHPLFRRLSALIQQQQGVSSLSSRLLPAVWSKPPAAKDGAKESVQWGSVKTPAVSPAPSTVSLEEQVSELRW